MAGYDLWRLAKGIWQDEPRPPERGASSTARIFGDEAVDFSAAWGDQRRLQADRSPPSTNGECIRGPCAQHLLADRIDFNEQIR